MSMANRFHPKLAECKQCKQYKHIVNNHPSFVGCFVLECVACCIKWYICPQHNKRFSVQNMNKLRLHYVTEHPSLTQSPHPNNEINDDDSNEPYNDFSDTNDSMDSIAPIAKKQKYDLSPTKATDLSSLSKMDFFSLNALQRIVGTAFANNELVPLDVDEHETNFHLNVTDFCCDLTESKQHQFAKILHKLISMKFISTRPPTTIQDIRRFYLSGKHSILNNVPCPQVQELDNHAYISIKEILTFSLSTLNQLELIQSSAYTYTEFDNSSINHCQKAKEILQQINEEYLFTDTNPYVLFVTFWSDDFEVNHTRRNRNSTWIKTMTLAGRKSTQTSKHYSHVVALGNKGSNHAIVNAQINQEIKSLQTINYYYVHVFGSIQPVIIQPLVVLADRPERCSLNETLSYTGNATRRWMYSSLIPATKLVSCQRCFQTRIDNYFELDQISRYSTKPCGRCCDFDYHTESKSAEFKPPHHYPQTKHKDSPTFPEGRDVISNINIDKLRPIKLTYKSLSDGVNAACFNLSTKIWKISETRSYLKMLGVSTAITDKIIIHCSNNSNKTNDIQNNNMTSNVCAIPLPQTWCDNLFQLDQFIETPMHHLFEGIIKSLLETTIEYLKHYKCWSKYCEQVNPVLDDINYLKCNFCRIERFWNSKTDFKPTGWIAENYLGYARIILVLQAYIDPLLNHNVKGKHEFECMIQSAFVLISMLMSRAITTVQEITDIIKIFLSTCDRFDTTFGLSNDPTNPFWYKKSNFISLLNLPDQINKFGPIYLYWEGVKERYIQYVKPLLKNKRKSVSYLTTKLQFLLQQNALDILKDQHQTNEFKVYERYNNTFIFASITDLEERHKNHECLTVLIHNQTVTEYVALCKQNEKIKYYNVYFDDDLGFHKYNLWFAPIIIKEVDSDKNPSFSEMQNMCEQSALLISIHSNDNSSGTLHGYTLLSSNWLVRTQTGTLELPKISRELFQQN